MFKYLFSLLTLTSLLGLISPVQAGGSTDLTKVKVTFIKYKSGETFEYVKVNRNVGTNPNIYNVALNGLIAGPTSIEKAFLKYKSSFVLTGASNCLGANYKTSFDAPTNTLTVQFCKTIDPYIYPGGTAGSTLKAQGRAKTAITQSLHMDVLNGTPGYQGISRVVIRNKNGTCFAPDVDVIYQGVCN